MLKILSWIEVVEVKFVQVTLMVELNCCIEGLGMGKILVLEYSSTGTGRGVGTVPKYCRLTHHHSGSTEYFLSRAIAGLSDWHLAGGLQGFPGVT